MSSTCVVNSKIESLIETQRQQAGFSLQQEFYVDPDIYQHEMQGIFFKDWIYACHTSQLSSVGDCQTVDIDKESIIVCRGNDMSIQAFANVCRHRGSRICESGASNNKRLTCPYHAWSYGLDGNLLSARVMPEDFDKSYFGLNKLSTEIFRGFVFVNLGASPAPFDEVKKKLQDIVSVFDLENIQLAHYESHPIDANWKLVYENYYECYHCGPAHNEYAASHTLALDVKRRAKYQQKLVGRAAKAGIPLALIQNDDVDHGNSFESAYYYHRYALFDKYLTGSEDGQPVAPLLGQVKDYDGGGSDLQLGNHTYLLIYADYVVLYRFTPRSVSQTDAELFWFVRGDVEADTIDLERLSWLWNVTTYAAYVIDPDGHNIEAVCRSLKR